MCIHLNCGVHIVNMYIFQDELWEFNAKRAKAIARGEDPDKAQLTKHQQGLVEAALVKESDIRKKVLLYLAA